MASAPSESSRDMCPRFEHAAGLLGKRWTGLILKVLMEGPKRFGELSQAVGQMSERVLSERLKELEAEGVLLRLVEPGPPVRVGYRLTEKGEALREVINAMGAWASAWLEPPAVAPLRVKSASGKATAPKVEARGRAVRP